MLHTCDVRNCVRGDHLYLGDALRNALDREERGRSNPLRGEQQPVSILTGDIVRQIVASQLTDRATAEVLGIAEYLVSFVRTGRSWRHITGITMRPGIQFGEGRYNARLTEDQVRAIRRDPRPALMIATEYPIGAGTVGKIKRREKWKHVTDEPLPLAA